LGFGSIYNHTYEPNAKYRIRQKENTIEFIALKDIKKDDIVYVLTHERWYRYKVREIKTVYPNDVTTVAPSKNEILTLFTCSGFFDEKRLIVKAYPQD
jgi:LPXTG-site transpeptidase (sortase) family protein